VVGQGDGLGSRSVKHVERWLPLTSSAHDRAGEHRRDAEWMQRQWSSTETRVIPVVGSDIEVEADHRLPRWVAASEAPPGENYLLGIDEHGNARFAVHTPEERPGATYGGLRELGLAVGDYEAGWLCHAVALAQWHSAHGHCARCGGPTVVEAGGAERRCPADGSSHFPRVDPAVIALVTDDQDRALLGRQAVWPEGRFSTLAGFVEPGETAEQAVCREVAEEAGITVVDVSLVATQPWPFPSSLMIGARARVAGEPVPRPDGDELVDVRWFTRSELERAVANGTVMVPGPISISRWLIDSWFGGELPDDRAGWR
jgi:NAD+ diphosphatase